jgi:hypothetical protein
MDAPQPRRGAGEVSERGAAKAFGESHRAADEPAVKI